MTLHPPAPPAGIERDGKRTMSVCPAEEILRHYLSGWTDDSQSEQVEAHLQVCTSCEQALQELEIQPDTLMQALQRTVAVDGSEDGDPADQHDGDPLIDALDMARQLLDSPPESAKEERNAVWEPSGRQLGMYVLQRTLGRGGMGAVYLATHCHLRKHQNTGFLSGAVQSVG